MTKVAPFGQSVFRDQFNPIHRGPVRYVFTGENAELLWS
jgi:hypothetical protein